MFITPSDLAEFVGNVSESKLAQMIADAEADASRVAPCLLDLETLVEDEGKRELIRAQVLSILRAALVRWAEAGSGAYQTQAAGPFSVGVDTRQQRRGMFWPSEITALQDICKGLTGGGPQRAFNVDQIANAVDGNHQPWCDVRWGWPCSCGAYLTVGRYPLWEGGLIS